MRGHKLVTIERQGGYAARCETCGDITFGGFATRTEARAALTHEENGPAVAATTNEANDIQPSEKECTMHATPTMPAWAEATEDFDGGIVHRSREFTCGTATGYVSQQTGAIHTDAEPYIIGKIDGHGDIGGPVSEIRSLVAVLRDMVEAVEPAAMPPLSILRFAEIADELGVGAGDLWELISRSRTKNESEASA